MFAPTLPFSGRGWAGAGGLGLRPPARVGGSGFPGGEGPTEEAEEGEESLSSLLFPGDQSLQAIHFRAKEGTGGLAPSPQRWEHRGPSPQPPAPSPSPFPI